jgi:hypothetical protein
MREVSIKDVKSSLQKTITWFYKIGKGRYEWAKSCKDTSFHLGKLNIYIFYQNMVCIQSDFIQRNLGIQR